MFWPRFGRYGYQFDPWREFERLQQELSRINREAGQRHSPAADVVEFPLINIWRNGDTAVVTAEIPGVEPEDVELSVIEKTLTIKGIRKPEEDVAAEAYSRTERGHGTFNRTVEMPFKIDAEKVDAHFKKGVLYVTLPRAVEDKPKKISVKVNQ